MKINHCLSSTYQFWDALIRYETAWLLPGEHRAEKPDDFLQQMNTVYSAMTALMGGFGELGCESSAEAAAEAEQGQQIVSRFLEKDSRLSYREVLACALNHWQCLGEILDQDG